MIGDTITLGFSNVIVGYDSTVLTSTAQETFAYTFSPAGNRRAGAD
jgi:hypothetical protein